MHVRWLVAALFVCFGSLALAGRARAQTVYTPDSLNAMLLTSDDVNLALSAVGTDTVTDAASQPPASGTVISATEVFKTTSGIVGVALFTNADGSAPSSDESNQVLSGTFLQSFASGVFDNVGDLTLGGSGGVGDSDQSAVFTGALQGSQFNVVADSFIKGNVFAAIFYATPGTADPVTLGAIAGTQALKLP